MRLLTGVVSYEDAAGRIHSATLVAIGTLVFTFARTPFNYSAREYQAYFGLMRPVSNCPLNKSMWWKLERLRWISGCIQAAERPFNSRILHTEPLPYDDLGDSMAIAPILPIPILTPDKVTI